MGRVDGKHAPEPARARGRARLHASGMIETGARSSAWPSSIRKMCRARREAALNARVRGRKRAVTWLRQLPDNRASPMTTPYPRLLPCGDSALVVEFGNSIDPELEPARAGASTRSSRKRRSPASPRPCRPIGRCSCITIRPSIGYSELGAKLHAISPPARACPPRKGRRWRVPVVYGGSSASISRRSPSGAELTPEEVDRAPLRPAITASTCSVSCRATPISAASIPKLATPRRQDPRLETPVRDDRHRRRSDRHPMHRRPERLESSRPHAGAHLSSASRSDLPDRARRSRHFLPGSGQRMGRARPRRRGRRTGRRDGRARRMSLLVVDTVGPATSVQDEGRSGAQRYGLTTERRHGSGIARHRQRPGRARRRGAAAIEIGPLGADLPGRGRRRARLARRGRPCRERSTARAVWINETCCSPKARPSP